MAIDYTAREAAVQRALDELYLESLRESKALFKQEDTKFPDYMEAELQRLEGSNYYVNTERTC